MAPLFEGGSKEFLNTKRILKFVHFGFFNTSDKLHSLLWFSKILPLKFSENNPKSPKKSPLLKINKV